MLFKKWRTMFGFGEFILLFASMDPERRRAPEEKSAKSCVVGVPAFDIGATESLPWLGVSGCLPGLCRFVDTCAGDGCVSAAAVDCLLKRREPIDGPGSGEHCMGASFCDEVYTSVDLVPLLGTRGFDFGLLS